MFSIRTVSLSVIAAIAFVLSPARADFPTVALKPVCLQQIHSPTTITYAPDGSNRVFICDQPGKIYILQGGMLLPKPFLDVTSLTVSQSTNYNERGLLGLAFHPGYANSGSPGYRKFYVYYNKTYVVGTDPAPPQVGDPVTSVSVIAEYQVSANDPNIANPASERRMLLFTRPQANHNGGQLEFGPDGLLYFGSGDGGSQMDNNSGHNGGSGARPTNNLGNGQDKTRYLGKILRIDPLGNNGPGGQYGIPTTNPFFNDPTPGIKKEIYAYGLRNPWRFSFDKRPGGTNRLFCGDVGGDRVEEVDIIVSGGNYGWRYKEGLEFPTFSSGAATNPMTLPPAEVASMIDPIAVYAHSNLPANDPTTLPKLGLSITGGFIYRGTAIAALQGKYVFGDYGSTAGLTNGRMMGLEETSLLSGVFTLTQAIPFVNSSNPIIGQRILCLGEDENGEIYVGMKTKPGVLELDNGLPSGGIYKIVPVASGTLVVNPSKDNSIFSELPTNSSGQGVSLFAGVTQSGDPRRALIAFDVSSVPAGASISSAQVQLTVPVGKGSNNPMTLHRVTQSWGEGASDSGETGGTGVSAANGDATWNHRFYSATSPTPWTTAGGDFTTVASATQSVTGFGTYLWTSTQLASDVQGWVNNQTTNNGWILIGDEAGTFNAKRIYSRQFATASVRPKLTVNYIAAPSPTHFESWLSTYFPSNYVGQYVDPNASFSSDGVGSLVKYAYGLSPLTTTPVGAGLQASSVVSGVNPADTLCTYTFQRDADAKDLTYVLQTSGDLISWGNIVQSTGGAVSSGPGFVSEGNVGGQIMLVTAQEIVPSPVNRFVRIRVSRAP